MALSCILVSLSIDLLNLIALEMVHSWYYWTVNIIFEFIKTIFMLRLESMSNEIRLLILELLSGKQIIVGTVIVVVGKKVSYIQERKEGRKMLEK